MADVTVANTSPGIAGKTLACHDANGVTTGTWSFAAPLALQGGGPAFQTWRLSASGSGNVTLLADGGGTGLSMNTGGSVVFNGDLYEKNRTTPLGHWIDVPFDAANFQTNLGAWTVEVGDVIYNRYTLIGKTLIWHLQLNATSPAGGNYLLATIPVAGATIATVAPNRVAQATNNGVACEAVCFRYTTGLHVGFALVDGTNWAPATNNTVLSATIILVLT